MSTIQIEPTELWQFSITTYQQVDIQQELLGWQNSYDGNVNLALFCMYCDDLSIKISDKEIQYLHQQVSQFSIQFTQAIRVTREHFKQQKALLNQYDDIRHHLLEAELILEQQEQGLLCTLMSRDEAEFSDTNSASESDNNWLRYQGFLTKTQNEDQLVELQSNT